MPKGVYIRTEKNKPTQEYIEKLRIRMMGNNYRLGASISDKQKQSISEKMKGNQHLLGHHHSIKTKERMSEAHKNPSLEIRYGNGKATRGKYRLEETKLKISEALKGENNGSWKGGISPLAGLIRTNFKSRQWRSDVYTRDDFTCQECGIKGGKLNVHHIKSFSSIMQYYEITTLKEALECGELWNINNGVTLCEECHKKYKVGDRYACNYC